MSFVQNFPFFTIILSLVCAVSSFVLKKNIAKWISAALLSVSSVLNLAVLPMTRMHLLQPLRRLRSRRLV